MSAPTASRARSRRRNLAFWAWYLGSLGVLMGCVQVATAAHEPEPEPDEVELTIEVMAVPPKPDGARARQTDGDEAGTRYTMEQCQSMPESFADTCFSALARQQAERDPDGALEACAQVGERELQLECMADVGELHSSVDVDRAFGICKSIPKRKWADQCVFGIAMTYAISDTAFALATCEKSGRWKRFCRHDVNGERSVVDQDGALAYCASLDTHEKKQTCYHGVGKYIGRVDMSASLATCARVPVEGDLRGQCLHGAGWAAAETESAGALRWCTDDLGALQDSCIMGVAYQAKRFAPDQAVELCNRVQDASERSHCLDFVQRTATESSFSGN